MAAVAVVAGLACVGVAGPATASPLAAPGIHAFRPSHGAAGTKVTITGSGFTRVRAVRFAGVTAKFRVRSASRVTAVVPAMPSSAGRITVVTRGGTTRSRAQFTVVPGIVLSPSTGPPGSVVAVSGTGFGAGEQVGIVAGGAGQVTAPAGRAGSFGPVRITIPASTVPGMVGVSATGGRTGLVARAGFTVSTSWAQFRFSAAHTGFNPYENVLSPADVGGLTVAWSIPAEILGTSPVVAGRVVYAGSANGEVFALNAATGARRWTFRTRSIQSSPAVAGGTVYVGSWTGHGYGLTALNAATGARRWTFSIGRARDLSAPTVAGGTVYFGSTNDKVYALNAATGARRWAFTTGGPVHSSPAVAGGQVYLGSDDGHVYALSAATGAKLWAFNTFSVNGLKSSPAVVGGVVYVGSDGNTVYALNAASGAVLWTFGTGNPVDSSPAVAGGEVYVGARSDLVFALNATTGAKLWTFHTMNVVSSSPAVANGVIYIGCNDNNVYALNAATGAKLWTFTAGNTVRSSPAVANGMVYIGSDDNHLYAFGLPGVDEAMAGPRMRQSAARFRLARPRIRPRPR